MKTSTHNSPNRLRRDRSGLKGLTAPHRQGKAKQKLRRPLAGGRLPKQKLRICGRGRHRMAETGWSAVTKGSVHEHPVGR